MKNRPSRFDPLFASVLGLFVFLFLVLSIAAPAQAVESPELTHSAHTAR